MSIFGGSGFVSGGGGGGSQGTLRYAVMVDSRQATVSINQFKQSLTTTKAPVQQLDSELKKMSTDFSTTGRNATTFNTAISGTGKAFSASTTPIKQSGDALANYNKNLVTGEKQTKSIGTQVKDTASKYGTFAIGLGSTVTQVVSLQRQYRDLVDSQIAVDRTARKMSLAQEAVDKTTAKVIKLQKEGKEGSTEYASALRDQDQAHQQLALAVQMHDEALEAQGDIYQNFTMTIIPAAITAVGTLGSAIKDLGLSFKGITEKLKGVLPALTNLSGVGGFGGVIGKIKETGTRFGGLGSLLSAGLAIGGAALIIEQVQALQDSFDEAGIKFTKMKHGMLFSPAEAELSFKELDAIMKKTGLSVLALGEDMEDAKQKWKDAGGKVDQYGNIIFDVEKKVVKLSESTVKMNEAQKKLDDDEAKLAAKKKERQTTAVKDEVKHLETVVASDKAEVQRLKTVAASTAGLDKMNNKIAEGSTVQKTSNASFVQADKILTGFGDTTANLAVKFQALNKETMTVKDGFKQAFTTKPEHEQFFKFLDNGFKDTSKQVKEAQAVMAGFGDTIGNLGNKFGALNKNKVAIKFPTADVNLYNKALAGWGSTAKDTTKLQADLAAEAKKMAATMKADQKVVSDRTAEYLKLKQSLEGVMNITDQSMEGLQKSNKFAEDNLNIVKKQNETFKENQKNWAAVTDEQMKKELADRKVAMSMVNLNSVFENTNKNILAFKDATLQGAQAAEQFITDSALAATKTDMYDKSLRNWLDTQLQIPESLDLTTSQLQAMTDAQIKANLGLKGGAEAAKLLADAVNEDLNPSLQTFQSAISADKFKDFKKALKDLPGFGDFSKNAKKDLSGFLNEFRKVGQIAKEVQTDISAMVLGASFEGIDTSSLKNFIKNLKKDVEDISKIDVSATNFKPITDYLDSLTDENRAAGILKVKDSLALMQDAMADGVITEEEAHAVTAKFNEEMGKTGTTAGTAADEFGRFTEEAKTVKVTAQVAAFVQQAWGESMASVMVSYAKAWDFINQNPIKVTTDVETVKTEIMTLEKVKPQISLMNNNAMSSIATVKSEIPKLEKIKPQISLMNKNAMNSIDSVKSEIPKLEKVKPQISLQNRNAFNSVDAVKQEIMKLEKLKPTITVKVKYDTSGKPSGISAGARVGTDIGPSGNDALTVNLYNYNNDRETMRTFKRNMGKDRYTLGI